jgi:predicted acetyltransferase
MVDHDARMDLQLRPVTDGEFRAFVGLLENAFGFDASSDDVGEIRALTDLDRTIGVFDSGRLVSSAGAFSFELTLPGGVLEPAAGVTFVTVRGTHRRQGILRRIMDHQLDDVAERGECLAVLTASEGSIYRRFGYGPATYEANWSIPTEGLELSPLPGPPGSLRVVDKSDAVSAYPAVYDQCRRQITGAVNRRPEWWDGWFGDRERDRDGASARYYMLHEDPAGVPDGMLAYRLKRKWEHGLAQMTLLVDQLYGTTPDVESRLWQFAFDHDLVRSVAAPGRPIDEMIRWRLTEPRRLRCTQLVDSLWVRLLDIPRALATRRYRAHDALVLAVTDPFRPANDGTYLVEGGPEGAESAPTDREPDLALDVADLGSLYLGGVSPTSLARVGRVRELTAGALARADVFFGTSPAPWLTTHF